MDVDPLSLSIRRIVTDSDLDGVVTGCNSEEVVA